MARKVVVSTVDDLTGEAAGQTVLFGLDGVEYQIDLSMGNAKTFRRLFVRYVAAARRTGGRKVRLAAGERLNDRPGSKSVNTAGRRRNQAIREWARDNGYEVLARGRIPASVVEDYENSR